MVDVVDKATRSRMMSGIRGRNTKPEVALRKALHRLSLRFRLHDHKLPGRPDIVLPKFGAVVQVHGCFWHHHPGCRFATSPGTNQAFWTAKFEANVRRDRETKAALLALGWRVAIVWECSIKDFTAATIASKL